ncbi:unnamed protein product [Paramecium pentaurelia]|uniref:Uncharacterized protein n=1 Tax=Paramecium pentaurelia TaxID=43138 RepID=A0A8S1W2Q0_9CILI|nr:unnamed protein product [Paramecium pentaurelia]
MNKDKSRNVQDALLFCYNIKGLIQEMKLRQINEVKRINLHALSNQFCSHFWSIWLWKNNLTKKLFRISQTKEQKFYICYILFKDFKNLEKVLQINVTWMKLSISNFTLEAGPLLFCENVGTYQVFKHYSETREDFKQQLRRALSLIFVEGNGQKNKYQIYK